MARVELKDQLDIRKSVEKQGGYCSKWASGWQLGKPDLICAFPILGSFFMEVKSLILGEQKFESLSIAPKKPHEKRQRYELLKLSNAGAIAVIGVVVHQSTQYKKLFIVPWWIEEEFGSFVIGEDIDNAGWYSTSKYNVKFLMGQHIAKILEGKWQRK